MTESNLNIPEKIVGRIMTILSGSLVYRHVNRSAFHTVSADIEHSAGTAAFRLLLLQVYEHNEYVC